MSWSILADPNRIVRENINRWQMRKRGDADRGASIIAEDEEGGPAGAEDAIVSHAVHDAAHGMFANAEVKVASSAVLAVEVPAVLNVVERGSVEIGATACHEGHGRGDVLKDVAAGFARGNVGGRIKGRNSLQEIRHFSGDGIIKFAGEFGIRRAPSLECFLPLGMGGTKGLFASLEVGLGLRSNKERFVRQAEGLAGLSDKFHATFAVGFVGARDFGDSFANDRLCDEELRFSGRGSLGFGNRIGDGMEIVAVDMMDFPTVSSVAGAGVLALRNWAHGVEGDVVGIVDENQVVQAKVPGESAGFLGNAFL